MNQDQVKKLLFELEPSAPEFILIFTGKASKKVHGFYKPESREILLHNKNFSSQEELIYTAIHEFAHHLHFCSDSPPPTTRSHNGQFWNLFHRLLRKAEENGLYRNVFQSEKEFLDLTEEIKEKYLETNGELMKDFGRALLRASELCKKYHVHFEDYMDRILCIPRITARTVMTSFSRDVPAQFGYDHLKTLSTIRDPELRQSLAKKLEQGYSPDMLKQELKAPDPLKFDSKPLKPLKELDLLKRSRDQLRKKILALETEVNVLEEKIAQLSSGEEV